MCLWSHERVVGRGWEVQKSFVEKKISNASRTRKRSETSNSREKTQKRVCGDH